jgi:hypothetical protein
VAWERFKHLERERHGLQYGTTLTVELASVGPDQNAPLHVARDLVKWVGEKTDIFPWRVYLSPWQPRTTKENVMPCGEALSTVLQPPLVQGNEAAQLSTLCPPIVVNFGVSATARAPQLFAKVRWGSGGNQFLAWVDWPARGGLLQVSGSYVQVDAYSAGAFTSAPDSVGAPRAVRVARVGARWW